MDVYLLVRECKSLNLRFRFRIVIPKSFVLIPKFDGSNPNRFTDINQFGFQNSEAQTLNNVNTKSGGAKFFRFRHFSQILEHRSGSLQKREF